MQYEFSLAHMSLLKIPPPELVEIAAKTGYQYVSLRISPVTATDKIHPLINNNKMMKQTKMRMADTGIKVHDIELVRMDFETEPEVYFPFFEAGAELGARAVIVQLPDADRERANARFARLCDMAKPLGMTVDLEFISWSETPDLKAAEAVLRAANKPNAGILVDFLQFHLSKSSLKDLKELPRDWFHFVHLCDIEKEIPKTLEERIHLVRHNRIFPGEGDLNLHGILGCMPEVVYSVEIPNDVLVEKLGPEEHARRAIQAAKKLLNND